ncbi:MAG: hypothetical protein ACRDI2_01260 [Chloroflexota bacterium]
MEPLTRLLDAAPEDPLLLAGAMLLVWLPVCALGLGCLAVLAAVQYHFNRLRRPKPGIVVPPATQRPLVTRRFITNSRRTNGPLAAARLALAVGVVVGFTVLVLASSGPLLLATLRS